MHNYRRQVYIAFAFILAGAFVGPTVACLAFLPGVVLPSLVAVFLLYGNHQEWRRNYVNRLEFHKALNGVRDAIAELGGDLSQQITRTNHRISNVDASVGEIRTVLEENGFEFPERVELSGSIVSGVPRLSGDLSVTQASPRWRRYYLHLKYWISREAGFRD